MANNQRLSAPLCFCALPKEYHALQNTGHIYIYKRIPAGGGGEGDISHINNWPGWVLRTQQRWT